MLSKQYLNTSPDLVSVQGRVVNELKKSFGQAPAVAQAIARTADKIYRQDQTLTVPGTILYSATHISEPAGKPLDICKRSSVKLSIWKKSDDLIIDMKERKKHVFKRIVKEAYDQDGVLTIEDCKRLMLTGIRTLKEYISEFRNKEIYLPLRGYVHSTGRGQTHKNEIICYYLEGMDFFDIQMKTYHSVEAITRYLSCFQRIVILNEKQNMKIQNISTVVNVSTKLVEEYLKIYNMYSNIDNERLDILLNPRKFDQYILPYKKKLKLQK